MITANANWLLRKLNDFFNIIELENTMQYRNSLFKTKKSPPDIVQQ